MAVENPSSLPRVAEQRGSVLTHSPHVLHDIRSDVVDLLFYRWGSPHEWRHPVVLSYQETPTTTELSGGQMAVVRDGSMLVDIAAIIEPWRTNALLPETATDTGDETALAVAVLETETYMASRLPHDTKVDLKERYGVIPLDPEHVLFQGLLRDVRPGEGRAGSMAFEYKPVSIISGESVSEGQQILQLQHARNFFLRHHPENVHRTPMELLIGGGRLS